ncbi:5-deoxy-glucuronate isomerase [Euzebya tangerina]|uniref:5-deoxy-glucuronate isomerase n=1 Tax=Euzebya tangerina TaxID=591198 RepID=UPI000E3109A9|nr:5-deoxy-glucuronate isomerase [Euzebya tangerina]
MTEPRHHLTPASDGPLHDVTPESAGWRYLSFAVHKLAPGEQLSHRGDDREMALTPITGSASVSAGELEGTIGRPSPFDHMPEILYAPPGTDVGVEAGPEGFEFALGGAPAEGRYPVALNRPAEMETMIRGGGGATRQVNNVLAHPLKAERLILFEVYVPRGMWSGWPPHCHDGYAGSPYLEETYYFRLDPDDGWAMHRNYRVDEDFDETFAIGSGDLVLVTKGFHSSAASPGHNMWFLNYLAGELQDDERARPPFFQPEYTWIDDSWDEGAWSLPRVEA